MQSFLKDSVKGGTLIRKIFPCGAYNWPCGASVNAEQFYTKGARAGSPEKAVFWLIFARAPGDFFIIDISQPKFKRTLPVFPACRGKNWGRSGSRDPAAKNIPANKWRSTLLMSLKRCTMSRRPPTPRIPPPSVAWARPQVATLFRAARKKKTRAGP